MKNKTEPVARRERRDIHGILLLDKPHGLSSNKALQRVKYMLSARKAGHTGSLDPAATGMLPLCFGDATRYSQVLLNADKTYLARATLGELRDTGDAEGQTVGTADIPELCVQQWQVIADQFIGEIEQVPPMYSALKHEGKRLYELARAGEQVTRAARKIVIHDIRITAVDSETVTLKVRCSKGTYIRTLLEDIAAAAGTLAWTSMLRRLSVHPFDQPMVTLDALEQLRDIDSHIEALLLPTQAMLADWPTTVLGIEDARRFCMGQRLAGHALEPGQYACFGDNGLFLGTSQVSHDQVLRPTRVMTSAQQQLAG
ncbi:MAG: tRNA pseudouridine(55) synthase TruB [Pseudomonadota bacterium]